MPFKSRAQQRFLFSQHPKVAKEWAEETDFGKLPNRLHPKKRKGVRPRSVEGRRLEKLMAARRELEDWKE